MQHNSHNRRSRGHFGCCLLGGAVGDALGAPVEFLGMDQIRAKYGPAALAEYDVAHGRLSNREHVGRLRPNRLRSLRVLARHNLPKLNGGLENALTERSLGRHCVVAKRREHFGRCRAIAR